MSLLRNRFVWIGAIVIALAVGGFLFMSNQAQANKAKAEQAAAAAAKRADNSPYVAIANRQAEIMMRIASEFGFTPASRSRISTQQPTERTLFDALNEPHEQAGGEIA